MPANVKGGGRERGPQPAAPPQAPARRDAAARRLTYKDAGVDIDAKMRVIQRIRLIARTTFKKGVLNDIGSFGGLYDLTAAGPLRHPILVSSTDGVGTKLKVAIQTGHHKTIGMDLVNHCINDILVQGAVPLFFLDYIAMGKVDAEVTLDVISGLARSCRDAGCALIGEETAEMTPAQIQGGRFEGQASVTGSVVNSGGQMSPGLSPGILNLSGAYTQGAAGALNVEIGELTPGTGHDQINLTGSGEGQEALRRHEEHRDPGLSVL